MIEFAHGRKFDQRTEPGLDLGIEIRRTLPPNFTLLAVVRMTEWQKPEIENVADRDRVAHVGYGMSFLP